MIFVDANVVMYLVGDDRARKLDALAAVERLAAEQLRLVTSSEVFQELLHRYVAIRRREAIEPAFETLRAIVDDVLPVAERDVIAAKNLVQAHEQLSARDALHVAVMRHHEIVEILTFDSGFDAVSGIGRLPAPAR